MSTNTPETNRQAGVPLSDAESGSAEPVATGDRRGNLHYEPDPDQLVAVRSLVKPHGPLPPEEQSAHAEPSEVDAQPIEDVRVPPASPSVWDARPTPDDRERSGAPTGH